MNIEQLLVVDLKAKTWKDEYRAGEPLTQDRASSDACCDCIMSCMH